MPLRGGPVPPRGGPCAAERRPLCREEALCAGRYSVLRGLGRPCVGRRLLCREEAICAGRSHVLKEFKEASVSGGGSLSRMVLLLYAEGIEGGPYAERRPLCRREEAPVPRGGPLCRKLFCAERIGGGPCVGRRLLCREEALCAGRSCPLY